MYKKILEKSIDFDSKRIFYVGDFNVIVCYGDINNVYLFF